MFKLLKEIFKSLSKNKITVISLSILLFLTTGVFSLLFSVKESFRREVDRYSQVSKLHDSTVDLDINFANSNKNSIYYKSQENEYTIANNEVISNTNLRLPSNFIKLSELGIQGEEGNFYISANEFKVQYEINKNTYDLSKKEFSYDLANATFSVLKDKTKLFKKYKLNADGSYTEAKSVVTLKKDSTIVLDKQYTLNDVVTIVSRGEVGGLFNAGSDGQVSAINRLAINVETREATFDAAKINTWDNFGLLYLVSEEDTARILGFERNGSSWKIIRRRDYSSDLFNWDDIAQWAQPTIAWNYNTVYKPEGKMKVSNNTSPVIKNLSIANDYSVEFPQTFSFAKANTYKLNKAWISTTSTEIKYKKVTYKLYDISDKHRFSNAFSIYLKRLKEEQPQEFTKIESLSFWQKEIVTTDAKNQSKTISQRLSKDDLVIELKDKKDPSKTVFIKDLENLGNELNIRELTNEQLYQLSNSDIVELSYLKLKNAVSQTVKEAIYKDINEDKRVLEIGERKFITVNSINDSTGENKIYQFIDSGISNDLYRENQAQNVGKLFNETLQKSNLFLPEDTSIQKNEINVDFSTQIIAAIFQGYVPNKNFIDPRIEFINIMYKDKDSIFETEETNKKVVILKSKTTPSLEYALGENKGNYSIFVKNNENWEPFYYKTKSSLSIYELNEFIASNDLILDAKIGQNGWFKENDEFSNSYSVPFLYRTPSSELLKEIETNKTIKSLTDSIKKAIVNSDLISEHYIQLENIEKLLSAMEQAWAETGYYQIFINGKNDFALMQKMIFETLYIATNQNNDGFLNDIISDFISKIKEKISLKPTLQEQKDYFFEEFEKLGKMLDNFGLSFWKNLIEIAPLNYLKTTINSPIEFLEGIRIMVDSFDFKQFLSEVHNWYIQKWDTQENSELKAYYYFGQADLVVPLLKSINYDTFKQGAIKIVDQINFDSLFSTLYDNSENRYKGIIFNQLIKNYAQSKIKDQLTNTLKEIFNKINANKDLTKTELNFSNVKEGIKTLINNFDKKQLLSVVETSLNNTYFEGYKTVANSKNPQKVTFVTKTLKNTELAVSFIAALFKDSNTRVQVNNAIKSILNLSGKTKYEGAFTVYYSVPDKDDQKLDLFSLQNLEILSYANYEDLETKTDQLISKITQNSFVLDNSDIAFIKKNLFKNSEIYDNKTEILKRLNELKTIINFFKLNAYKKQGNYFIKQNDNLSIADNLYALFNESFQDAGGNTALIQAKDKAKAIVSDVVHTSEFSAAVNSLVFYDFWIKFITENPQLSQAELNEAFNLIFDTVNNKSSQLYQILNNTTLYDNKANFSQATLAFGQDIQPLGRGILQPFETSQEIFSSNSQNSALAQEVNKLFTSELFTKQTEQHKETLAIWISKNKAQFVSSIAQIAHFRKFHGASKYFDYLKKGFSNINKLLENDSKKEIIENVLKTFSQQSSIMQALGLSDVVASTYQGVIFPTVAAWFTTNPSAQNGEENNANLT
ncbi:hypothetical protein [Mycoplasma procyoni]|uniref:hypothetical protein n=1 Tax=Mycoplasma procyoni TaxID=568784 RepID=UPI00197BD9E0|nr:hypothetical protein [Mycoplasma procyoni]MBN3534489.1 hypothetical protein [Mycoplasma procyoni]